MAPTTASSPVVVATRPKRRQRVSLPTAVPPTAPARNTRSQTRAAAQAAAPPARNARVAKARAAKAPPVTPSRGNIARKVHVKRLASAKQKAKQRRKGFALALKALAVMDKHTGKMLNYRQLIRHRDYKATWSLSSANKFG